MVRTDSGRAGQWIKTGLSALFSLVIIGWAVVALDWRQVGQALAQAHLGWIVVAMGLTLLTVLPRTWRWQALFWPQSFPLRHIFSALLIGQTLNYILPARAGDLARIYLLDQTCGVSKARVVGTIALEKLWDMVMLVLFIGFLAWFFPLPDWLVNPAISLAGLTVAAVLALVLMGRWRQQTLNWFEKVGPRRMPGFYNRLVTVEQNLFKGFSGLRHPKPIVAATWWSALTWIIGGLTNYAVFRAFNLPLAIIPAIFLLVVLQVGVAVPSLPGRIGVFEGLCVFVLALFDVSFDVAFGYGLVLHVIVFIPPMILAALLSLKINVPVSRLFAQR